MIPHFFLVYAVPTARIVGSSERYVDRGSTINLTCIINHNPDPPSATFWYHNNKVCILLGHRQPKWLPTDRVLLVLRQ